MGFEGLVVGDWNGHGQVAGCTATDCPRLAQRRARSVHGARQLEGPVRQPRGRCRDGHGADGAARRRGAPHPARQGQARPARTAPGRARRPSAQSARPAHLALAREAVGEIAGAAQERGRRCCRSGPARACWSRARAPTSMAMQSGGWTISWQGTDVRNEDFPNGQTIGRALVGRGRGGGRPRQLVRRRQLRAQARRRDRGVRRAALCRVPGRRPDARLSSRATSATWRCCASSRRRAFRWCRCSCPAGRCSSRAEINASDAFVAAWLPGTQADGVADVLVAGRDGAPAARLHRPAALRLAGRRALADRRAAVRARLWP